MTEMYNMEFMERAVQEYDTYMMDVKLINAAESQRTIIKRKIDFLTIQELILQSFSNASRQIVLKINDASSCNPKIKTHLKSTVAVNDGDHIHNLLENFYLAGVMRLLEMFNKADILSFTTAIMHAMSFSMNEETTNNNSLIYIYLQLETKHASELNKFSG